MRLKELAKKVTVKGKEVSLSAMTTLGAADPANGLWPIVGKLQEFALPVGIVVALWGLMQYIMGDHSGQERVKMAFIGYIGVFIIPMLFKMIRDAFA